MNYQEAIETLINQIYKWYNQENYEEASELIAVLLNALSSKKPDVDSAKSFVRVIDATIFKLIDANAIQTLQAFSWVDKALRLANSLGLTEEQRQLAQLQGNLRVKIEEVSLEDTDKNISTATDMISNKLVIKNLNNRYKKYFDQVVKLLEGGLLPLPEITELVKSLKNIIFNDCREGHYPKTEKLLEQTLNLCRHYLLETDVKDLAMIQQYLYPKEKGQKIISSISSEEELAAEQEKLELEINVLAMIESHFSVLDSRLADELSDKLAIQLLVLSQPKNIIDVDLQTSSFELITDIIQQFSKSQDVGLACHCLDKVIRLAENLNFSEQRSSLSLMQGDLFSQKQVAVPNFNEVVASLTIYFDLYFGPHIQPASLEAVEIETKISTLEIRALYHVSKPWIIQRLMKNSDTLENFKKTFDSVTQIGHRLISYGELDLAWNFYAGMQSLLTQSTQHWHEEILVKLAEISCIKQNPKLLNVNDYPQASDWQKHRNELMQYRQELGKDNKSFSVRQKAYTKSVMRMIAGWLKDAETLLGPRPDRYCILAVGSMSRYTAAPYSDLECIFLAADSESARWDNTQSEKAKYFSALYRLLEYKMACLGELRGFRLDSEGHARVEDRLRGTPSEVLRKNHPATHGVRKDDEMTYSILSPIYLCGDKDLEREYHQHLTNLLEEPVSKKDPRLLKDFLAVTYLPMHAKYLKEHDLFAQIQEINNQNSDQKPINIKKDYISPIMYAVADICLYYRMRFTNTDDFINQLKKDGKISSDFAETIQRGAQLADEIRVKLHLYYGEQNDEAMPYGGFQDKILTFTQAQQETITLIALGLLKPLRFVLESLQNGDETCLFNPLQAMIEHAVNSKDKNNIEIAVQSTLYALTLAKVDTDNYRLAYLAMPSEARIIFQKLLYSLKTFLPHEKINLIQQACLDCPLPNGIRENQQEKEERYNAMLGGLIVSDNKNNKQKDSKESIKIQWINSQGESVQGNLHPEVIQYLTDKGYLKGGKLQITTEKIAESDGRHMVISLDLKINGQSIKLYLKIFPEMPGMECAVSEFTKLLAGFGAPFVQLARLEIGGKVIPVLLSQTVVGKPLHIMIKNMGDELNQLLNPRRFHQRALLSILLNQEDGKPSNFIMGEDENKLLEMICVDNDRSFFPAIVEEEGRLVPIVKDISYCFALMQQKVDPIVAAEILQFDAYALLNQWLKQLEKISAATDKLFTLDEMQEFFPKKGQARLQQQFMKQVSTQNTINETILPITFSEHTLANLYVKLTRLQNYLIEHPEATLFDLLSCAEPYLAKYYRNLLQAFPNIVERFKNGFSELYGEKPEKTGAHQTKKTTFATLQTLHGKPQDAKTVLSAKNTTLEMARAELKLTHAVQQNWKEIYLNIMKGSPEGCRAFAELPDMRLREIIFNQIDFSKLPSGQQQLLLRTLMETTTAFRSLKLINCNSLTDEILSKILLDSPELEILVINNCPLLTERTVINIAKNCPILETLSLTKLTIKSIDTRSLVIPSLFTPMGGRSTVVFAELRALDVTDCKDLGKLYIEAPKLSVLIANNCFELKAGKCRSRELRNLELSNCASLTTDELAIFVTHFPYLKNVVLDGCDKIEKRAYYMKFPYLLRINLSLVTDQYLQQLMTLLEKFHAMATDEKQISQLLENLHEYFDAIERGVSELIKTLSDPSPDVQKEAAFYIKDVGRNGISVINPLKQQLLSQSAALRTVAGIALLYIDKDNGKDKKIMDILEKVFASNDKHILKAAIPLLNQFGSETQTENICLQVLEKGTQMQGETIIYAFGHWESYSTKISDALKQIILGDKSPEYRAKALYAYWQLEMKNSQPNSFSLNWLAVKSFPPLLCLITKFDPAVALTIRKKLKNLVIKTDSEVDFIIQQITVTTKEKDGWSKRVDIVKNIGENQIQHEKITQCLLDLLQKDTYFNVRAAAIEALNQLQLKTPNIDEAFAKALDDRDYHVVIAAAEALSTRGIAKKETRKKLLHLASKDEHWDVRQAAFLALENIRECDAEILDVAIKCLSDDLVAIKSSAIKTFVKLVSLEVLEVTLNQTFNNSLKAKPNMLTKSLPTSQKFLVGKRGSQPEKVSTQSTKSFILETSPRRESTDAVQIRPRHRQAIVARGISGGEEIAPQPVLEQRRVPLRSSGGQIGKSRDGIFAPVITHNNIQIQPVQRQSAPEQTSLNNQLPGQRPVQPQRRVQQGGGQMGPMQGKSQEGFFAPVTTHNNSNNIQIQPVQRQPIPVQIPLNNQALEQREQRPVQPQGRGQPLPRQPRQIPITRGQGPQQQPLDQEQMQGRGQSLGRGQTRGNG